jgi:hypothetical protein
MKLPLSGAQEVPPVTTSASGSSCTTLTPTLSREREREPRHHRPLAGEGVTQALPLAGEGAKTTSPAGGWWLFKFPLPEGEPVSRSLSLRERARVRVMSIDIQN